MCEWMRVCIRLMLGCCDKIKVDFAWHEESKMSLWRKEYNFFVARTHEDDNMGLKLIHTQAANNNNNHL